MSARPCTITGCERPHNAHGLCKMHYRRWRIHGDPLVECHTGYDALRRFPPQPLLNAVYARVGYMLRDVEAAEVLLVHRKRIAEWRQVGVTWPVADRICSAVLNVHPLLLWPDFYDDIDTSEEAA